mmetsp:Transcript_4986/g.10474  ORF Transcript_4986/g.10474 Transcript_4986/m.10474 type:complete len:98 (+) Transcript_4986:181-474(+)
MNILYNNKSGGHSHDSNHAQSWRCPYPSLQDTITCINLIKGLHVRFSVLSHKPFVSSASFQINRFSFNNCLEDLHHHHGNSSWTGRQAHDDRYGPSK